MPAKHRVCPRCLVDRAVSRFREDPTNWSGRAAECADCQDGKPIPEGLEGRRKLREKRFARNGYARKLRAAGYETACPARPVAPLSEAAANRQGAYCAFLYEAARLRLRDGKITLDDPEYRDALKSMEFLLTSDEDVNMVRANGIVYRWDKAEGRLDRRVEVGLAEARGGSPQDEVGIRVFREPRFQPERGVPARSFSN